MIHTFIFCFFFFQVTEQDKTMPKATTLKKEPKEKTVSIMNKIHISTYFPYNLDNIHIKTK